MRPRVAFISPCGWGNLGDAAIQESFIAGIRARLGRQVEIYGITQNPPDIARRHGVPSVPVGVTWRPGFPVVTTTSYPSRAGSDPDHRGDATHTASTRRRRGPTWARFPFRMVRIAVREVRHWRFALAEMRRTDALVVSGGGQVDAAWGGAFGMPYALFKWSLAARMAKVPVIVLSVGAGTVDDPMTRRFMRLLLNSAAYVSFRDPRSAELAVGLGFCGPVRVVPDLAFDHPAREDGRGSARTDEVVVGVSPIAYLDDELWLPHTDGGAHAVYLSRTVELVRRLIEHRYVVRLFTSDAPDVSTARRVYAAAVEGLSSSEHARLELAEPATLDDLLGLIASCDVVVASRLHGVILSHVLAVPTLTLSYDWKVRIHVESVEMASYTHEIGEFRPDEACGEIETLVADRGRIGDALAEACAARARAVSAQYDEVADLITSSVNGSAT